MPVDAIVVLHADELWVSKRGLNGTGTVGTAPGVWNCNLDDSVVVWDPSGNSASRSTYGF